MSKLRLIRIAKQNVRSKERRKASIRKHQFIFIMIAHLWEQKIHENSGKNIIFSYLRDAFTTCKISTMSLFQKIVTGFKSLKAVTIFTTKAPWQMFGRVLNTVVFDLVGIGRKTDLIY